MTAKKKPANNPSTGKKKKAPTKTSWQKGQSGNPAGRPKDGESWASIIKQIGDSYPEDITAIIGANNDLGRAIKKLPPNVQMKYLISARVFAALMFEPTAGLWNGLMDRAEGKVKEQIELGGTLDVENLQKLLKKVYGRDATDEDQSG